MWVFDQEKRRSNFAGFSGVLVGSPPSCVDRASGMSSHDDGLGIFDPCGVSQRADLPWPLSLTLVPDEEETVRCYFGRIPVVHTE